MRPSREWRRACGRPSTTWTHQIYRNTGETVTASGGPTVLANDRYGGRLRLNASRHSDDARRWKTGTTGWAKLSDTTLHFCL